MAGVLELAQLAQHDRVAEVDVGRRGVDPELHAQLAALQLGGGDLVRESARGEAVDGVRGEPRGRLAGAALGLGGGRVDGVWHEGQC